MLLMKSSAPQPLSPDSQYSTPQGETPCSLQHSDAFAILADHLRLRLPLSFSHHCSFGTTLLVRHPHAQTSRSGTRSDLPIRLLTALPVLPVNSIHPDLSITSSEQPTGTGEKYRLPHLQMAQVFCSPASTSIGIPLRYSTRGWQACIQLIVAERGLVTRKCRTSRTLPPGTTRQ